MFAGILSCSTRLIPKEKVREYNDVLLSRTYIIREDLVLSKSDSIRKGSKVRVYVESTPSLLKVKCYPIEESREYAIGRMAIYRINEEVESREIGFPELEEILAEKFDLVDSSSPKKRK